MRPAVYQCWVLCAGLMWGISVIAGPIQATSSPDHADIGRRTFQVQGTVRELPVDGKSIVVSHEAIPNYMDAMTMPFKVRHAAELTGLQPGDSISFRLVVAANESWAERIVLLSKRTSPNAPAAEAPKKTPEIDLHDLRSFRFTNELNQPVSLNDFKGQALGITFFFTRCPIPDFCPRLSKNFQETSQKLSQLPNAPTNWHLLSFTFDPEFDTPAVLKTYAERYQYDSNHWSFLTGPADRLAQLAAESDVKIQRDGSFFNHNFRTLVVDTTGQLQMIFPTGGNLSDALVTELIKAAAVTNQ